MLGNILKTAAMRATVSAARTAGQSIEKHQNSESYNKYPPVKIHSISLEADESHLHSFIFFLCEKRRINFINQYVSLPPSFLLHLTNKRFILEPDLNFERKQKFNKIAKSVMTMALGQIDHELVSPSMEQGLRIMKWQKIAIAQSKKSSSNTALFSYLEYDDIRDFEFFKPAPLAITNCVRLIPKRDPNKSFIFVPFMTGWGQQLTLGAAKDFTNIGKKLLEKRRKEKELLASKSKKSKFSIPYPINNEIVYGIVEKLHNIGL